MDRDPADPATPEVDPLLVLAHRMDLVSRLAGGLSHDLANPLAAITAFGDLIRRDESLPPTVRADADLVVAEAGRAQELARTVFEFLRRRPAERHPTAVDPLLRSVLALTSFAMTARNVRAELVVGDDLPAVAIDRPLVQHALLALVTNAIEALEGAGVVRIEAAPRDGAVRISVIDDGAGVASTIRPRVFEPRFTTRDGALGLGLPIARAIIEAHGGRLELTNGAGPGATFVVDLPGIAPAEGAEVAADRRGDPAHPGGRAGQTPTVLVVDDEEGLRRFLGKALEAAGLRVVATGDAAAAVRVLEDGERVDAVLCDLRLPGMSGLEAHAAIVAARPALGQRFGLMSGDIDEPGLRAFADREGVRLIAKPFDLAAIRQLARELVDGT